MSRRLWAVGIAAGLFGPVLVARAEPPRPAGTTATSAAGTRLAEVDPAWQAHGWRATAPVAYVLGRLVAAREAPLAAAPVAFWLKGGTRVPVLEQRAGWWRIGWSQGRAGWMPAAELEASASVVLLEAATGRLIRRLPAKSFGAAAHDGRALWALLDNGFARLSLDEPPALWFRSPGEKGDSPSPVETVWTPDHKWCVTRIYPAHGGEKAAVIETATGAVRHAPVPEGDLRRVDGQQRLLLSRSQENAAQVMLYDLAAGRLLAQTPGNFQAAAKEGPVFISRGQEVVRCDALLKPGARVSAAGEIQSACLSADETVLAVCSGTWKQDRADFHITLLRADTLAKVLTIPLKERAPDIQLLGLSGGREGWSVLTAGEGAGVSITRYSPEGRRVRAWHSAGIGAVSPDGSATYMTRPTGILMVRTADGTARSIPYSWRRPLPARYVPKPTSPGVRTRLSASGLSFSPDGRTLILSEWLNNDADG